MTYTWRRNSRLFYPLIGGKEMRKGSRHDSDGLAVIALAPRFNASFDANLARDRLDVASNTAGRLAERASDLGIVERVAGDRRFRVFRYTPYWRLPEGPRTDAGQDTSTQITEATK